MRYSPEALTAFVEAVDSGSFSAAARRLRKSQSTISTAIANLEADLGVTLVVQTEKMTCLMVRFHSDSFILFWFQGQTRW